MILTLLLIVLVILLLGGPGYVAPESQHTVRIVLIVLLIVWLLFAFGIVGNYGYWHG